MTKRLPRRRYLIALGTAGIGGLTGCLSGADDSEPTAEDEPDEEIDSTTAPSGEQATETPAETATRTSETEAGRTQRNITLDGSLSGYPTFGYDSLNSGYSPDVTGPTAGVVEAWRFRTDKWIQSTPAVVDGTVYIGSRDSNLYAIDAATGVEQWRYETGDGIRSSPTVVDGTVYIGGKDFRVHAVDAADGTREWQSERDASIYGPVTVAGGVVFTVSKPGFAAAYDAADGSRLWRENVGYDTSTAPAVVGTDRIRRDEPMVLIGTGDGQVVALSAESGREWWANDVGTGDIASGAAVSSPAVGGTTAYVNSNNGTTYAVDIETGETKRRYDFDGGAGSKPAVVDGTIYFGGDAGLRAVDADSGTQQWLFETGDDVNSSPTVAGETVYFGAEEDHRLYAVDAATGTERWRWDLGDRLVAAPAVVDGAVFVGGIDYNLYALTGA